MNPGSAAPHHSNCFDRKPVCISVGRLYALITALLFGAAIAGCDTTAPSLYDPDRTSGPDPKIDSITPTDFALAGVDTVTIDGANFSITPSDNLVYFNDARGDIAEASATRLVVAAPNTPGADIEVRVAVLGAENYSNGVAYRLEAAAEPFGNITGFEEPFSITSDAAGNLYVSLNSDGRSAGVLRMAPDGARSPFVETTFIWTDMAYGDDNLLYTVRTVRAVFRFAEGGRQEVWGVIPDNSAKLSTIAFDEEGNLWAGGNNDNVYRIAPDKSIETFPFEANVRDLTVFDGHLYAAATREGASTIWRWPISGGRLGEAETWFDVTGSFGAEALALAFATNGDLFVGTSGMDPVLLISPDRQGRPFYPGILLPAAASFAWGAAPSLYMVQGKTDTTPPGLIRINTRREGVR